MKSFMLILLLAMSLSKMNATDDMKHSFVPEKGFVPDERTAVAIAVAVLTPIYGRENIRRQRPFSARLDQKGIWIVEGSLPSNTPGGTARAEIAKADGRVVRVTHSK